VAPPAEYKYVATLLVNHLLLSDIYRYVVKEMSTDDDDESQGQGSSEDAADDSENQRVKDAKRRRQLQQLNEFERAGVQKYLYTKRCEEEKAKAEKKVDAKSDE